MYGAVAAAIIVPVALLIGLLAWIIHSRNQGILRDARRIRSVHYVYVDTLMDIRTKVDEYSDIDSYLASVLRLMLNEHGRKVAQIESKNL